jgi:mannosyltransferase OCH1-like enzyme
MGTLENTDIPNKIIRTYHCKNKIPSKVYENIKEYAPNSEHIVFDDDECIDFLKKYFDKEIVEAFKNFKIGPHKADLFRYCYLYKYGGIYFDIKTIILKRIEEIFYKNYNYTVLAINENYIYQGIIACQQNNKIFLELIQHIIENVHNPDYQKHTTFMREKLKKQNIHKNWHLFKEVSLSKENCENKLDRYGYCTFILNEKNEKIFKTRWWDYPYGKDWN